VKSDGYARQESKDAEQHKVIVYEKTMGMNLIENKIGGSNFEGRGNRIEGNK